MLFKAVEKYLRLVDNAVVLFWVIEREYELPPQVSTVLRNYLSDCFDNFVSGLF